MSRHLASSSKGRLTAAQIVRKPEPEPELGLWLYQRTNEVRLPSPIVRASGRLGDEVYHWRGGRCFVRRYAAPRDPDGVKQLEQQDRVRLVMPAWTSLSAEVRKAWLDYSIRHFGEYQPGKKRGNLGQNLFMTAQYYRLAWGEGVSAAAPSAAPPRAPIQVVEVPAPAGQMAWRVEHGLKETAGYRLEVMITPPAREGGRPKSYRLVRAGAATAESFFSLAESGTIYVLENPVHEIAPGARYGLQIRIVTADGLAGRPLYVELTRRDSGAGEFEVLEAGAPESAISKSETRRHGERGGAAKSEMQQLHRREAERQRREDHQVEGAAEWMRGILLVLRDFAPLR